MIGMKVSDTRGNEAGSKDEATYPDGNKQVDRLKMFIMPGIIGHFIIIKQLF